MIVLGAGVVRLLSMYRHANSSMVMVAVCCGERESRAEKIVEVDWQVRIPI